MAKYTKFSGVIEARARNGKGLKIGEDWYTAFKAAQVPEGIQKGDTVEFEYEEVNRGGATFFNIKGDVKLVSSGGESKSSASSGGSRSSGNSRSGDGRGSIDGDSYRKRSMKFFPVPHDDVDLPIIRQNSLTQANSLVASLVKQENFDLPSDPFEAAELVVEIARIFEAYSTGQGDAEALASMSGEE
jgi:hypothetical protein